MIFFRLFVVLAMSVATGGTSFAQTVDAEIVAPGIVSTSAREFAISFGPDGEAYFNRVTPSEPIHIWIATPGPHGALAKASKAPFSDPRYADVDPFFSHTRNRLYFSSDRPRGADSAPTPDYDTWVVEKTDGGWSAPRRLRRAVNTDRDEVFVSEDAAGAIYFARFGEGEGRARPTTLYRAVPDGADFAVPEIIPVEPSGLRLSNPAIAPDGRRLIALGVVDDHRSLFSATKSEDGVWSSFTPFPVPAGVNAYAPYVSNSGGDLYVTSDHDGDDNIYRLEFPADALE